MDEDACIKTPCLSVYLCPMNLVASSSSEVESGVLNSQKELLESNSVIGAVVHNLFSPSEMTTINTISVTTGVHVWFL